MLTSIMTSAYSSWENNNQGHLLKTFLAWYCLWYILFTKIKNAIIYLACTCVWVFTCHGYMNVRGQLAGIGFVFLPDRS